MGLELAFTHHQDGKWAMDWPGNDSGWALLANAGAVSNSHIDAAGYCTYMRCLLGSKIWIVAKPFPGLFEENDENHEKYFDMEGHSGGAFRPQNLEWEYVYLAEGDEL